MDNIQLVLFVSRKNFRHRTQHGFHLRRITQVSYAGNHIQTDTLARLQTFTTQADYFYIDTLILIFLYLRKEFFQYIGIQTTTQPFVSRNQNKTNILLAFMLLQ